MLRIFKPQRYFSLSGQKLIKKFYKSAQSASLDVTKLDDSEMYPSGSLYTVTLDGHRKIKTPDNHVLCHSSAILTNIIAEEFLSQTEWIIPQTMPMLGMTKAAVDVSMSETLTEYCRDKLVEFLSNDTLVYREPSKPDLLKLQEMEYRPVINTFENLFALKMNIDPSLLQPTVTSDQAEIFRKHVEKIPALKLLPMEICCGLTKSCIISFMLMNDLIDVPRAFELSRLEEDYQAFFFGKVDGFHDMDEGRIIQDLYTCKLLYDLS